MTNDTSKTDSNVLEHLKQILGTRLSVKGLEDAGRWLAKKAAAAMPGATGPERKAWGKKVLLGAIEQYDNLIPVAGAYLDLPFVDGIEKSAVDVAVEKGYAWLVAFGGEDAPVTDAPELTPGEIE